MSTSVITPDSTNEDNFIQPAQLNSHLSVDSEFYSSLHRHLSRTVDVLSISENLTAVQSFLVNGNHIVQDLPSSVQKMVEESNASFFIDLGVCADPAPYRLALCDGLIVQAPEERNVANPFLPSHNILLQIFQGISEAKTKRQAILQLVSSTTLKREVKHGFIVDNYGNYFSYAADVEPLVLGGVPGEQRHILSSIKVRASSFERHEKLRNVISPQLRPIILAMQVALTPPALSLNELPWRSIFTIGSGLFKWIEVQGQLQDEESFRFFAREIQICKLGRNEVNETQMILDPLSLLSEFLGLCKNGESISSPDTWDKGNALRWCAFLAHSEKQSGLHIWQVAVSCEHMAEASNEPALLGRLAVQSRQLSDLLGTRLNECAFSKIISIASSNPMKVANAVFQMSRVQLGKEVFNPKIIGPVSPGSFDHLGPSYFGAPKLNVQTCTSDGIPVGKGRAIKLAKCRDTLTVRRGLRRIMMTVENRIVLVSQNTAITDFKSGLEHVSGIEAGVSEISVRAEFEHVNRNELIRTDSWRIASRTLVQSILRGDLNTDASVWLLHRIRNGDVAVSNKSKSISYLIGSNCSFTSTGVLLDSLLDPAVTKRLPTYIAENRLWIDIDNKGDLRLLTKKTNAVVRVENDKFSGSNDDLLECSVRGEYCLDA